MITLILAAMLLHISWATTIRKWLPYMTEKAQTLLLMIPFISSIILIANPEYEQYQTAFYAWAMVQYIAGLFTIYLTN